MNKVLTTIFGSALIFVFALSLWSFAVVKVGDDWAVPEKYKTMKNPHAGQKDTEGIGLALWKQHCQSCHGKEGYGDGTKAATLETEMRDLTSAEVKSQSDGVLYYKSYIGRDEMPNFEKKIPAEEDRWLLVNYIRTLK